MAQKDSLLDFFGHSVKCTKASTRVPTQITCQIFKEHPAPRWRPENVPCHLLDPGMAHPPKLGERAGTKGAEV
jgi:hypothetical protein